VANWTVRARLKLRSVASVEAARVVCAPPVKVRPAGEPLEAAPCVTTIGVVDVVQVCAPVHVGAMDCDRGGAPSDLRNVVATPLTADSATEAVGLAPDAPEEGG
jgi:hypothetical protein